MSNENIRRNLQEKFYQNSSSIAGQWKVLKEVERAFGVDNTTARSIIHSSESLRNILGIGY